MRESGLNSCHGFSETLLISRSDNARFQKSNNRYAPARDVFAVGTGTPPKQRPRVLVAIVPVSVAVPLRVPLIHWVISVPLTLPMWATSARTAKSGVDVATASNCVATELKTEKRATAE